jgi:4-hydroxyphenylpyruvate dioxygenase
MGNTSVSNPLGIKSIDHLEFTTDNLNSQTAKLFETLGFVHTESFLNGNAHLYSQGQIRFLLKNAQDEQSLHTQYFKKHGEGVSKISFLVDNAELAIETAIKRGAKLRADLKVSETENGNIKTVSIQGFGDVINEFVERPNSIFRANGTKTQNSGRPLQMRCSRIDHFTNNVPKGEMEHWVDFYKRIYGFKETRYFDIKGKKTGLFSKVVQLEDNSVIIPINEPESENSKSQIQEFLDRHKGAGVQHIALMTADIMTTTEELQKRGINFLKTPHTYYEDIPKRGFKVEENINELERLQLLVDGDEKGYLLQIFSDTYIGPLFFEYIQRKNHWGFGEGNFQALFDSIERDQIQRGYI